MLSEVLQTETPIASPPPTTTEPGLSEAITESVGEPPAAIIAEHEPEHEASVAVSEKVQVETPAIIAEQATTPIAKPIPTPTPTPAPKPPVKETLASEALRAEEQLLLRVKDTSYFLQLMAGVDKNGIIDFRLGLPVPATIYRRIRQGKLWYVVVAGPYPDMDAAGVARDKLPKHIRDASPWRRPATEVKAEIRQFAATN